MAPKITRKTERRECNVVTALTESAIEVCTDTTVLTCGAAKMCRPHQRLWNRTGTVKIYVHGHVRIMKARR